MKFNKIFLMFGVAALTLFSSCSDDDDYTPGAATGKYNVSFTPASQNNKALELTATDFTLTLQRADADVSKELTVPLENRSSSVFTVPQSVTFAAGSATAEIKIGIADTAKAFVDYSVNIVVPEEYTNQYAAAGNNTPVYPRVSFSVHKEDWQPYAEGKVTSGLFETSWDQELDYSPYLKLYRLRDLWETGYHFYFKWDGKADSDSKVVVTDAEGTSLAKVKTSTGASYGDYGLVSFTYYPTEPDGQVEYVAADATFHFRLYLTVSAGAFGFVDEAYTITKKL